MRAECPSVEQLKAFSLGNLDQERIHEIAEHVLGCQRCDAEIKHFDNDSDELVRSLQGISISSTVGVASQLGDGRASTQPLTDTQSWQPDPGKLYSDRLAQSQIRLDKFTLLSELGSGSFGYVFRAYDHELDREVAIKIQRARNVDDPDEIQRFIREAKSAARLKHPSIVSIYETRQTDDGVCYLVTEFIEGQTLEKQLKSNPIDFQQTANFLAELADALHYAHGHGIVHRDVKPSNIMIDDEGKIHLTDFGLAKRLAAEDTVTQDGQVMGTPAYMSPEQAKGLSHEVDGRSDIYSLGVIMYEMLTGQQPFQGKKRLLLLQVLEDDPRPPSQLNDKIPRDLEIICLRSMSKLPRLRYATAGELAADLRRYLRGEPIVARPVGYRERFWRWCQKYPLAVAAFLMLLIGSIGAVIYLSQLSRYLVRQTARDSAEMQAEMLDAVNEYYARLVKEMDVHLQENDSANSQIDLENLRPVPARFTIELGKFLQSSESVQVRLYSDYPFPQREDGGPWDDFGRRALRELEEDPHRPVYDFTELDGRSVVRYATARVMTQSCVECHNHHPDTPKDDWHVGDVRGVLEIIRPLERDQLRTRRGLGTAITWIVTSVTLLTGFVFFMIIVTMRRKSDA